MITIFGDRGLPVFHAGHWLWHRPHSVQVVKSSIPFQVKSSILPRPKTSSSSGSSKSIGCPDRKSTRLNSSHANISYAVFCLKKNTDDAASQEKIVRAHV